MTAGRLAIVVLTVAAGAVVWHMRADEAASTAQAPIPRAPTAPAPRPGDARQPAPQVAVTARTGESPREPPADDAATLDKVGRARLAQGIDAKRDGNPEKARALIEAAATALGKSIDGSGDRVDPWTLASMAQAQLELGNAIEAVAWADRALQQLRQGSGDDYTQFRAAQLTMSVGIVYYRAGQKQTGIAYMDQAMSMAPSEFDRADFSDLKEETIGG